MTATAITLLVVFIASVLAAAISGAVGFGGALVLLPILTRIVGPEVGVPLLTTAQFVGNLSRALFGARSIAWRAAVVFLATAIPSSVAGSYCFVALPKSVLTRAIGVAVLCVVVLKWRGLLDFKMTFPRLAASGAAVGFLSGLMGTGGPLGAAAFLALDLPPTSYIATEATTAVVMHAAKLTVYSRYLSFDMRAWQLAAILSSGMIVGSWLGKRTVERLSVEKFRVVVGILLVLISLQMIVVG